MSSLLVSNIHTLVTMDEQRREIADGAMLIRDGWIEQVGTTAEINEPGEETVDLADHIVLPGLINTHHHLYQTLTRAIPDAQNAGLFDWLRTLYPIWSQLTPHHIAVSTQVGLAELALSGCTTTSDHLYLFPPGCRLDDQIEAAGKVGIRFHAARGSMSLGESDGGLPPDHIVEDENFILADTQRLLESYHQPEPGAMLRVVVAPCSPFSVSTDAMQESAELARSMRARLHTHLAETWDEDSFCRDRFGMSPIDYAESVGWLGEDVWYAHAVHIGEVGRRKMAASRTGVAHCPTSNMRLASGIAPLRSLLKLGVPVGLGVDGSASNDSSHMLAEVRQAMLLSRLANSLTNTQQSQPRFHEAPQFKDSGPEGMGPDLDSNQLLTARGALEIATRGGAEVLGRPELGSLQPGQAADFIALNLNRLEYAGALHDPVAAAVFCTPQKVEHSFVHGRQVVKGGELLSIDLPRLIRTHNQAAKQLLA